jgi:hypothetical protein
VQINFVVRCRWVFIFRTCLLYRWGNMPWYQVNRRLNGYSEPVWTLWRRHYFLPLPGTDQR